MCSESRRTWSTTLSENIKVSPVSVVSPAEVQATDQLGAAQICATVPGVESPTAFRQFLSWLDQGDDSGGERYVEMRRRLVGYFARKRCASPDELADETLTRVAKRLEEQGTITDVAPARYCYIVARFVFLEYLRSAAHRHTPLGAGDDLAEPTRP